MTPILRLAATLGLAGLLSASAVPAFAYVPAPSATGAFLAGQHALGELRTGDSVEFLSRAAAAESDVPIILQRAFIGYATDGQIEAAANTAQRLLQLDPGNDMARIVIATRALKERRYESALRELNGLGMDTFEGITGAILKAWALTGQGRLDEAFAQLEELSGGGLEDFLVFHKAIMAAVAGRSDLAISLASDAYDLDPQTPDIVEVYARALGNAGRFDDAIDAIVQYEARGFTHPIVSQVKEALLAKRRPGPVAANAQAGAAEMFYSIGIAFAREGSNDVALVFLRLGSYLSPGDDLINFGIGQLYDGADQHEKANAIYDAIPASSPMKAMAIVRVADNLDALGHRPEAIERLREIVASSPNDLDAVSALGDLLRADKQYLEAAKAYSQAIAITGGKAPGDWRFFYVRGIAYERAKEWPKAESDLTRALQLNPNQPQVLNYLGYSWVDQGMNLDNALDMIKRAITASPQEDGYIIDSLGWAYYRLGRYEEAVTQLERAAVLKPIDPEINDHLGDAYWKVGRKLEARFQWNVASSVDTEGNVKERAAPKLAYGLDAVPVTEDSAPIVEAPATTN
ncbi:MAG TPA: tetratricopeptide repeat protein [Devosia sp.]|nr:tetratricopeptide repeat protein [Devosia sp.]